MTSTSQGYTAESDSYSLSHSSRSDAYYDPLQVAFTPAKPPPAIPVRWAGGMSPISTLPVELLSRVFCLGLPQADYPDYPPNDEVPFEILVSHVCQHWRNVALRTHDLWTTIHFRLVPHLDRAKHYLTRSQHRLIDILVDTCAAEEHIPSVTLFRDEFLPAFSIVTPFLSRWRSLSLKVRDRQCKLDARTVLSTCGGAPNLEYMQLWHIEDWDSAERLFTQIGPPPVVVFDNNLPALKHVVLIGVNVPWNQSPFLEDLSTVEFALHSEDVRIPYDIWAHMLSSSPDLYKLSLHYSGPRSVSQGWPTDVITLPGLRELILTDMDCSYILQLMERLRMPNLTSLRLELHDREQDFSALLAYFSKSPSSLITDDESEIDEHAQEGPRQSAFPILETLTIAALDCSPDSFASFLASCSCLRTLEVTGAKMADGLFKQLWTGRGRASSRASTFSAKGKEHEHDEAFADSYSQLRLEARSTTRASSFDTARSCSSTRTLSTAPTSPHSAHSPLDPQVQPTHSTEDLLLPQLQTVRISGVDGEDLRRFIRFRQDAGRPVANWFVSERLRDDALELIEKEMLSSGGERLVWVEGDEDEEEDAEDSEGYVVDSTSQIGDEEQGAGVPPVSSDLDDEIDDTV
ncbi:hypothetical protein BDW22DRAFT_1362190 [Trametopsis cervina]|nr:hypothetical protein BDW22DRAFT_1362190 [Trametopsis cervina]